MLYVVHWRIIGTKSRDVKLHFQVFKVEKKQFVYILLLNKTDKATSALALNT